MKASSIQQGKQRHQGGRFGSRSVHDMQTSHTTPQHASLRNIHTPITSHITTTLHETNASINKTHQMKLSQSCRENYAIKAADIVAVLRMTCRRHIRRHIAHHCTTYTPQPPDTSHPHTTKQTHAKPKTHQLQLSQSCRENNAIKAADLVADLRMTCRRQIQRHLRSHQTMKARAKETFIIGCRVSCSMRLHSPS